MADDSTTTDGTQTTPPAVPVTATVPAAPAEDVSGLKSALTAERAARKEADKTLKELQAWKQEQEDRGKSETDRLKAEADRAKQAMSEAEAKVAAANEQVIRAEVKLLAQQAGFADPEDAWPLLDRAAIALDDNGVVTGADKAVKALAEKKPHLLSREHASTGAYGVPTPGRQGPPGSDRALREEHERMAAASGRYTPF